MAALFIGYTIALAAATFVYVQTTHRPSTLLSILWVIDVLFLAGAGLTRVPPAEESKSAAWTNSL